MQRPTVDAESDLRMFAAVSHLDITDAGALQLSSSDF
jgi:hypothetical protein